MIPQKRLVKRLVEGVLGNIDYQANEIKITWDKYKENLKTDDPMLTAFIEIDKYKIVLNGYDKTKTTLYATRAWIYYELCRKYGYFVEFWDLSSFLVLINKSKEFTDTKTYDLFAFEFRESQEHHGASIDNLYNRYTEVNGKRSPYLTSLTSSILTYITELAAQDSGFTQKKFKLLLLEISHFIHRYVVDTFSGKYKEIMELMLAEQIYENKDLEERLKQLSPEMDEQKIKHLVKNSKNVLSPHLRRQYLPNYLRIGLTDVYFFVKNNIDLKIERCNYFCQLWEFQGKISNIINYKFPLKFLMPFLNYQHNSKNMRLFIRIPDLYTNYYSFAIDSYKSKWKSVFDSHESEPTIKVSKKPNYEILSVNPQTLNYTELKLLTEIIKQQSVNPKSNITQISQYKTKQLANSLLKNEFYYEETIAQVLYDLSVYLFVIPCSNYTTISQIDSISTMNEFELLQNINTITSPEINEDAIQMIIGLKFPRIQQEYFIEIDEINGKSSIRRLVAFKIVGIPADLKVLQDHLSEEYFVAKYDYSPGSFFNVPINLYDDSGWVFDFEDFIEHISLYKF
ncbi:MAG: hypothetical protein INQ03_12240 [Candidatus Heimdallarchaeota archaeon]|nr:hypothetical protein [Candidatus Heimdallarchaeota archaeon]